jgi:hypothetical protein
VPPFPTFARVFRAPKSNFCRASPNTDVLDGTSWQRRRCRRASCCAEMRTLQLRRTIGIGLLC